LTAGGHLVKIAPMTFFDRLSSRAAEIDSPLCVGLDPRLEPGAPDAGETIVRMNRRIIEHTADLTLCYKPNIAFYEQHGPSGLEALQRTLTLIPDEIPVLLDAKRGDIGATAEAYAAACVGLGVDAVTVSPYMGHDSVEPFTRAGLAVFVLCRTSNPGSADFQRDLSLDVARTVAGWPGEVGLVVAGNDLAALRAIRSVRPDAWFLAPGIGAQGGAMDEAVAAGLREDGLGLLPVVARGIANADDPAQAALSFVDEFRAARDGVGAARDAAGPVDDPDESDLLHAILATGCFRVGSFTLKSGIVSPFYIDLRRLQSDPAALETAAAAYERLIVRSGLRADRIAGIPVAALSLATALSLRTRLPLIYPRLPAKPHGTGNRIEGAWEPGERALLVDDLITTGLSKLEAVAVLREDGLVVEDLLVLIERGTAGRSDLAAEGIRVHAAADIRDLVERGVMRQYVTPADRDRIFRFLQESP